MYVLALRYKERDIGVFTPWEKGESGMSEFYPFYVTFLVVRETHFFLNDELIKILFPKQP